MSAPPKAILNPDLRALIMTEGSPHSRSHHDDNTVTMGKLTSSIGAAVVAISGL